MKFLIVFLSLITSLSYGQAIDLKSVFEDCVCEGQIYIKDLDSGEYYKSDTLNRLLQPGLSLNHLIAVIAIEKNLIDAKDQKFIDAFKSGNRNYFSELSKKIGKKAVAEYLTQLNYATGKFKKYDNELNSDKAALEITLNNQLILLEKSIGSQSGFKESTTRQYMDLYEVEKGVGYNLFYKKSFYMHKGWLFGWIEQNDNTYAFTAYLNHRTKGASDALSAADDLMKNSLRKLDLYDIPEKQRIADSIAAVVADTNYTLKSFYGSNPNLAKKVDEVVAKLSPSQIAGQMIIPAGGRWGNSSADIEKAINSGKIGGLLLLKGEKEEFKGLVKKYNAMAEKSGSLPLMYSSDAEPSLFNGKIKNTNWVPKTNTLTTVEKSQNAAIKINKELKEIGIQYNYAPDCDLGVNKAIIGNRSYGNDTKTVAELSQAFIKQSTGDNIVTTAKHFPGHGLVKGDSHLNLVVIDGEMKELDTYKRLIKDSVLSIMVGHIAIKNNEKYATQGKPSSCSPLIVTELLRKELGFNGLIVTDGMGMGALKKLDNAALQAAVAGCDLILMPIDILGLHKALLEKINNNSEFEKQSLESVKRIIRLKVCLGVIK